MSEKPTEGWAKPGRSKKWHFFTDMRSLCMKWALAGPREQGDDDSPDNCAECKRRLAARRGV